jgi:serine/threonine-protein kinase
MLGTLLYCAPEQILPSAEIDGRADLYSLGLVFCEMVTQRPVFAGLNERELVGKILYGSEENVPVFDASVPDEFVSLVRRAIARKPEDRYQGAQDFLRDIDVCLALPSSSLNSLPPEQPVVVGSTTVVHLQQDTLSPPEELPHPLMTQKPIEGFRRSFFLTSGLFLLGVMSLLWFLTAAHTVPALDPEQRESPVVATPLPTASPPVHSESGEGGATQPQVTSVSEATLDVPLSPEETAEKTANGALVSTQAAPVLQSMPDAALPPKEVRTGTKKSLDLSSSNQSFSSPQRFRITTLTAVRENPTWGSREITWLAPGARVYAVARIGEWLKVESRARPPKPPGFVWKADTRRE